MTDFCGSGSVKPSLRSLRNTAAIFRFLLSELFSLLLSSKWRLEDLTRGHEHGALRDPDYTKIRPARLSAARRPTWTSGEGSRGKEWAQRPDSAVCTFSGVQKKKKSSRARPPHPVCPPLPPWLRWPAPLCASQGRFLSQLGVLGCVAACLYWSVDFLVAACTYLNIPPGHCSVFPASHSLPPPSLPSLPPPASSPTGCSASHPLSYFITPSTHCPIFSSTFPLFPVRPLSSPPWTGVFLTAPPALSPPDSVLTRMRGKAGRCGRRKKPSKLIHRRLHSAKQWLRSWVWLV